MARTTAGTRTAAGARTAVTRGINYSLSFDGATAYVQANRGTAYNLSTFSVEFWVKGVAQQDRRVFGEGRSTTATPTFALATGPAGSTGKLGAFLRNDSATILLNSVASTTTVFDDTWHHVVWSDSSGTVSCYIDKVADATNFNYTRSTTTLNRTGIGALIRDTVGSFFAGNMDQVRIFNKAINQTEVNACYANDSGVPRSNLIYEWKFNENTDSLVSSSGNGQLQGVMTAATFSTTVPTYSQDISRSDA